jgi:Holliday junction resolvase RusA-like endonuclease
MKRTKVVLPWAALASSNQRNQRLGGRGHSWQYKKALVAVHQVAMAQLPPPQPTFPKGSVFLRIAFYPPDERRRDVHNYTKGLFDALEGVLYTNDSQIVYATVIRKPSDKQNPRVEVSAWTPRESESSTA